MIPRTKAVPLPVMVVDDDESTRECLKMLLESHGYDVITAGNGDEALVSLREGPEPGLILLDVMMPGMDGCQLRQRLEGEPRLADIPVVLCSCCTDLADIAARIGVTAYLRKPVDIDRLFHVVDRYHRDVQPGS